LKRETNGSGGENQGNSERDSSGKAHSQRNCSENAQKRALKASFGNAACRILFSSSAAAFAVNALAKQAPLTAIQPVLTPYSLLAHVSYLLYQLAFHCSCGQNFSLVNMVNAGAAPKLGLLVVILVLFLGTATVVLHRENEP